MSQSLKYDHDLRFSRRLLIALQLLNIITAILYGMERKWSLVAAGIVWCFNFLFLLRINRTMQEQRDRWRVIESALREALTKEETP